MEKSFPLPEGHGWKCLPGYKVIVLDHGAVRFDFPEDWHVSAGEGSLRFQDAEPPDDECTLEVSVRRLPLVAIDSVPLDDMLRAALGEVQCGPFQRTRKSNYRLVWTRTEFLDAATKKDAVCLYALGLATNLHVFLSYVFWKHDSRRCEPVWNNVLATLELGLLYKDPLSGHAIDPSLG